MTITGAPTELCASPVCTPTGLQWLCACLCALMCLSDTEFKRILSTRFLLALLLPSGSQVVLEPVPAVCGTETALHHGQVILEELNCLTAVGIVDVAEIQDIASPNKAVQKKKKRKKNPEDQPESRVWSEDLQLVTLSQTLQTAMQ